LGQASREFWIPSRTRASALLLIASVAKNSPWIGSRVVSPGHNSLKYQLGISALLSGTPVRSGLVIAAATHGNVRLPVAQASPAQAGSILADHTERSIARCGARPGTDSPGSSGFPYGPVDLSLGGCFRW